MADVNISQAEADALIAMETQRVDNAQWDYPAAGGRLTIPLRAYAFSTGQRADGPILSF